MDTNQQQSTKKQNHGISEGRRLNTAAALLLLYFLQQRELESQQRRRGMHLSRCLQGAFVKHRNSIQESPASILLQYFTLICQCWHRWPLFKIPYLKVSTSYEGKYLDTYTDKNITARTKFGRRWNKRLSKTLGNLN